MTLAATHINLRDALAVWRRNVAVHLRLWKLNLVAPIIEPVISVLGFGWGIGALVAVEVILFSFLTFSRALLVCLIDLISLMLVYFDSSIVYTLFRSSY